MNFLNEEEFENIIVKKFIKNKWIKINNIDRMGQNEVICWKTLKTFIIHINKTSEENANKAIFEIKKISDSAINSNIKGFDLLKKGIKIFDRQLKRNISLKIISKKILENKFEFIQQFEITNNESKRIPDIVVFLNGLPISVLELKSPIANERLNDAFQQMESLKSFVPSLFTFNLFNVVSNHLATKYGSITSNFKKYFTACKWKEQNKQKEIQQKYEDPITQLFNKAFLLKVITNFSFFDNSNNIKYLAAPHQIKAIEETIKKLKLSNFNNNKGGVVWHTQGSGKSITMLMLTRYILDLFPKSTILLLTDRNSLDRQLFERFSKSSNYLMNEPKEVNSRQDLIDKLNNKKYFGIFFTTIQKFSTSTDILSERNNIFILVDEAHRTQNNIEGEKKLSKKTLEFIFKFGYARYMRDAFPNAKLIGFTGTPLMGLDKDTTRIFGDYNDIYSMRDSIKDGLTVPILYEYRKLNMNNLNKKYLNEMDQIQAKYAKTLNFKDIQSHQKMNSLLKSIKLKTILENSNIIKEKTKDILKHLEIRQKVLHGKAMIIASSRLAAYKYYKEILLQDSFRKNSTILVITHSNKDSLDMHNAIVSKNKINLVASEFRKSNSKYKIAIVVDMWLTGFDVPDLDVMYFDKIAKWHNLMQAIARVNRTYEDELVTKESGLIVDYLGIWQHLSNALIQYANFGGIKFLVEDIKLAKNKFLDFIDVINKNYLKNIKNFISLNSKEQYKFAMNCLNIILKLKIKERNKFILIAHKIKRLTKISFTILSKEQIIVANAIQIVNSLVTTKNTQEDEKLKITIENIKKVIKETIGFSTSDVFIKPTSINKDINKVANLLEKEAEELREKNPLVAKKLLEDAINAQIKYISKIRPHFAKKASEKLQEILSKMGEKEEEINKVIDMLIDHSKKITKISKEKPTFFDPNLQAFYTIVADDKYLKRNKSSEVLRQIAKDLLKTTKEKSINGIKTLIAKNKLEFALRKILKNKYNYPPKEVGGISGILIDQIKERIDFNPDYFVGKKII